MRIKAKNVRVELDKILSGFANYRIIATTDDGGCLCEVCLKANLGRIEESCKRDGWHVVDLACDLSDPVQCDHCSLDATTGESYKDEEEPETACLVDGCFGQYVPQRFAMSYNMEKWNVKPEDAAVLVAGPDHPEYDETWDEVLATAKCEGWTLSQDGDLFAMKV